MADSVSFFKIIMNKFFQSVDNKIFIKKKMMTAGSFGKIKYNLFKEKENALLGQFIDNEIWLNLRLFMVYSKEVHQYVVLHELGHQKSNKLFLIADLLGVFLFFFGILFFSAFLVSAIIGFIFGCDLSAISFLIVSFGIMVLFGKLFKSLSESKADFFAIDNLSVKDYLKTTNEILIKRPKMGLFYKILGLSYPNPKMVAWAYRILHK